MEKCHGDVSQARWSEPPEREKLKKTTERTEVGERGKIESAEQRVNFENRQRYTLF